MKKVSLFDNLQIELIFGQVSGRLYQKHYVEIYFIKEKYINNNKKSHFVFYELILPISKYYKKEKKSILSYIL